MKDAVYVPLLGATFPKCAGRIAVVLAFTFDLFNIMWAEIEYRCDICQATLGALIEHL
jgi:hypothetical protein